MASKKYGKSASKNVESAMRRRKKGTLKSGSGKKVTSRKQAIAIGLSEAREKGAKAPTKKTGAKKTGTKKSSSKKSSRKTSGSKKSSSKKSSSRKSGSKKSSSRKSSR